MKRMFTLLFLAVFCFANPGNAQIEKGKVMLGGNLDVSANTTTSENNPNVPGAKQRALTLAPSLGFVLSKNTILGVSLQYSGFGYLEGQKTHIYGGSVFVRKYKSLIKDLYIFGEGNLFYNHTTANFSSYLPTSINSRSRENSTGITATAGMAYNLTRHLQVEAGFQNFLSASYSSRKDTPNDPANSSRYKQTGFSVGSSLNPTQLSGISFGFRVFI